MTQELLTEKDKTEIEWHAREILSWIPCACGDIANGNEAKGDDNYNDSDLLSDLCGDKIHDAATGVMSKKGLFNDTKKDVPYYVRCFFQIMIAANIRNSAHKALKDALDSLIERWLNSIRKTILGSPDPKNIALPVEFVQKYIIQYKFPSK